jgi:hypothetical protein
MLRIVLTRLAALFLVVDKNAMPFTIHRAAGPLPDEPVALGRASLVRSAAPNWFFDAGKIEFDSPGGSENVARRA